MLRFLKKHQYWRLVFQNREDERVYVLESESVGKLLGYISSQLEKGQKPVPPWSMQFVHTSNVGFSLTDCWPDKSDAINEVLRESVKLVPKLVRAKREPEFFEVVAGKRNLLHIHKTMGGVPHYEFDIAEQVELRLSGKSWDDEPYFFDICRRAFGED